jgi:hypothetical protein
VVAGRVGGNPTGVLGRATYLSQTTVTSSLSIPRNSPPHRAYGEILRVTASAA